MTPEESITLIKANLAEVMNPEIIDNVILKEKRPLRVYWGTAPTGKPHCGYFVPTINIAELLHAGCHVKILLADKHAHMDSLAPLEVIEHQCDYYRLLINSSLKAIGVDVSKLEFVVGSSFQDSKEYQLDRFRFSNNVNVSKLLKAGSEVVKQAENPTLGSLEYPIWQSLDEEDLDVDAELGGVDQRKLFTFFIDHMPKTGYKVRAHLMNPMVPGLGEAQKMSSSEPSSKINLLDTPEEVAKKLRKALKEDYESDTLTPQMIKPALIKALNDLLDPIRKDFDSGEDWKRVADLAYPAEVKPEKTKKEKDGNRSQRLPIGTPIQQVTDEVPQTVTC
uniref:Tyrosine--tRNA ligase n=1 Tax=Fusarium oxysporum (strain Fo5176) TaxID=660025 RepID=A0A0D2XTX7_FUSOF